MAKLKSKRQQEAKIEELTQEVESVGVAEEESPYMNEAEQEVLAEQQEKVEEEAKKISIARMEKVIEVAQEQFNLCDKGFVVTGFADKGTKCQVAMSSPDFDIAITIKDTESFGIM